MPLSRAKLIAPHVSLGCFEYLDLTAKSLVVTCGPCIEFHPESLVVPHSLWTPVLIDSPAPAKMPINALSA